MDFSTTTAAPVAITIDGTAYQIPRFLLPQFKAWTATRQKAAVDAALAQYGDDADARARFMLYFQPAPIDVAALIEEALTPNGIEYVIGTAFKAAGVPDATTAAILTGDVGPLRALTSRLLSAGQALAAAQQASGDAGVRSDPLPGQPPTSGGSATTTAPTGSLSVEPASTPTA